MTGSPAVPLRSDAERNRVRILDAARAVFAAQGPDAPLTAVAQHAGVGAGTLYRRFPTREDLLVALYRHDFGLHQRALDEALTVPEPWAGLCQYVQSMCELQASGGLRNVLTVSFAVDRELETQRSRLRAGIQTLMERAQADGSLRADVTPEDILPIMIAVAAVVEETRAVSPRLWRRMLALTLDGLRAEGAHPLPAPPLSQRELFRIQRRRLQTDRGLSGRRDRACLKR